MGEVTSILDSFDETDSRAAEELLPLVYEELRRLAASKMANEKPGQTLQATALVHEAYIKLMGSENKNWKSKGYFFRAAAEAMRRILVDNARRKQRPKHGGELKRDDPEFVDAVIADRTPENVVSVHEALDQLGREDPLKADVVKLRYFVGLTHQEIADALNLSETTVRRHWAYSKAWLYEAMGRLQ